MPVTVLTADITKVTKASSAREDVHSEEAVIRIHVQFEFVKNHLM